MENEVIDLKIKKSDIKEETPATPDEVMDNLVKHPPWKQLYEVVQTWEPEKVYLHAQIAEILKMSLPKDKTNYYNSITRVREELLDVHGLDLINSPDMGYFINKTELRKKRAEGKNKQAKARLGKGLDLLGHLPADTPQWVRASFSLMHERTSWAIRQLQKLEKDINKLAEEQPKLQLTNGSQKEQPVKQKGE